jgi:hypothetical protein
MNMFKVGELVVFEQQSPYLVYTVVETKVINDLSAAEINGQFCRLNKKSESGQWYYSKMLRPYTAPPVLELPPTPAEWTDMADSHLAWLRIAWTVANREATHSVEVPDDAREEIDEGLSLVVDFHERLMSMAVAARERWATLL